MNNQERVAELRDEIANIDEEIANWTSLRSEKYKELAELLPPKPVHVAVNSEKQLEKNRKIVAESKTRLENAANNLRAEIRSYATPEEQAAFLAGQRYKPQYN